MIASPTSVRCTSVRLYGDPQNINDCKPHDSLGAAPRGDDAGQRRALGAALRGEWARSLGSRERVVRGLLEAKVAEDPDTLSPDARTVGQHQQRDMDEL